MLNSFDKVVAERNPSSDIANQVYRNLLKREREKAYQAIQNMSQEISELQKYEEENTFFDQRKKETAMGNPFDFQGSFGEEKRATIGGKFKAEKENFMPIIKNPLSQSKPQNKRTILPKLNLSDLAVNNMGFNDNNRQVVNLFEKAIDSNRVVAFSYYARRLLVNGWRAFYNNRLENVYERFNEKISASRHVKNTKKKVFKVLYSNFKLHKGHTRNRVRATVVINQKLGHKYLNIWIQQFKKQNQQSQKMKYITNKRESELKLQTLKHWRSAVVSEQMKQIQIKTSDHIYQQKFLQNAWIGLKYNMNYNKNMKKQHKVSKAHYLYTVVKRALSGFQIWRVMCMRDREMRKMAYQFKEINLKKTVFKDLRLYQLNTQQYDKLKMCAVNYHCANIKKLTLEVLRRNKLLQQGLKQQAFFVDNFYQKKLKDNLIKFIMATNMEFMEHEDNVFRLMVRMWKRRILRALQENKQKNRIERPPTKNSFYLYGQKLIEHSFGKLDSNYDKSRVNYPQFLNTSKSQYYIKLKRQAELKLRRYYLEKIVRVWRHENYKVQTFIQSRKNKLITKLLRYLRVRSRKNAGYRYLLNRYVANKKELLKSKISRALSSHAKEKIKEREIVAIYSELRRVKVIRQQFERWQLIFKRKTFKQHQKETSHEIAFKKRIERAFYSWRKQYLAITKKREMKEIQFKFCRHITFSKFFGRWLNQLKCQFQLQKLDFNLLKRNRIQMLQKVFQGYRVYKLMKARKQCSQEMALEKRNILLLKRIFNLWKVQGPELKQKTALHKMIQKERNTKSVVKAIKGLKMYYNYKVTKKTSDHFMTKAIYMIKARQYLRKWRNLLSQRTGLQLLDYVVIKARQNEFFKRTRKQKEFEQGVERHLKLLNVYKLIEFAFNHLKKNISQNQQWIKNAVVLKDVKRVQLKKEVFRYWRGTFQMQLWEEKMTYFSIVQIKNQIMKKYFKVLKSNWEWKVKKVNTHKSTVKATKRKIFKELRKYARCRANCKQAYKKVGQREKKKNLKYMMLLWIGEIQELQILRDLFEQKRKQSLFKMLNAWKLVVLINNYNKQQLNKGNAIQDLCRKKIAISLMKKFTNISLEINSKIKQVNKIQNINLQKQIFSSFRSYISQNKEDIQKNSIIKKKVNLRVKRQFWKKWSKASEPFVTKVRVLKYLGEMQHKMFVRQCLHQWVDYTNESLMLDEKATQVCLRKQLERKKEAFQQLFSLKETKNVARLRNDTVSQYQVKKAQIRLLTLLRLASKLRQNQTLQKSRALEHISSKLLQKGLYNLQYYATRNINLRMLKKKIQRKRIMRHGPNILKMLKQNVLAKKQSKLQKHFSSDFFREKTHIKVFKTFLLNMMSHIAKRKNEKKSIVHHCDNLVKKSFNQFRFAVSTQQILQKKRKILENTLSKVDTTTNLRLIFKSLQTNTKNEQKKLNLIRGRVTYNKIKKIYSLLKLRYLKKKQLKKNFILTNDKVQFNKIKKLLILWMRALTNEVKIKVVQRLRTKQSLQMALSGLKRQVMLTQFVQYSLNKKALEYCVVAIKAFQNYCLNKKRLRLALSQIIYKDIENTKCRVFMSFKYETLIQKNLRILQVKQARQLILRAFSGWKYDITIDKTLREFKQYKYKQIITPHFAHWFTLYQSQSFRKEKLKKILDKKDLTMKFVSFTTWKKDSFREKLMQTLQENFSLPYENYIKHRCLQSWRRFTKVQNNKVLIQAHIKSLSKSLLARRIIREWYEASLHKMPARILGTRLGTVIIRLQKIKSLYLISEHAQRQGILEQNYQEFTDQKRNYEIEKCFRLWRKEYAVNELSRVLTLKRQQRLKKQVLESLKHYKREQGDKKDVKSYIVENLNQFTMTTQLRLTEAFQALGQPLVQSQLLKICLCKWFLFKQKAQEKQIMKDTAKHHYQQILKTKHFQNMIEAYQGEQQDKQTVNKANNAYSLNVKRKIMKYLGRNVLKNRKYKQADLLYNIKLAEKSLQTMRVFLRLQKTKNNLNTKMMYFLKKKCISLFKETFTKWRVEYENKNYEKRAVDEFDKFRNKKLIQKAFDYMVAIIQQQIQVKDMTNQARQYFQRKNYLRTVNSIFFALKSHAFEAKQHRIIGEDQELETLKYYALKLMTKYIRAWKQEVHQSKNRKSRSKLYALFSTWKFYTKERVLLKKYLKECNSVVDPNLLSTVEMRENVAKCSAVKSNFCESLTSGSPFTSAQRKVLSPLIINSTQPKRKPSPYGI